MASHPHRRRARRPSPAHRRPGWRRARESGCRRRCPLTPSDRVVRGRRATTRTRRRKRRSREHRWGRLWQVRPPTPGPRRRMSIASHSASPCRRTGSAGSARASAPGPCWTRTRHTACWRVPRPRSVPTSFAAPAARRDNGVMTRVVIVGGGPAGYESALVAVELGAEVTLVEREGIGGACVLTDCVPSKTLIATSASVTAFRDAPRLGLYTGDGEVVVDVNDRIKKLAYQQSDDIRARLLREGVTLIAGSARFTEHQPSRAHRLEVVGSGARSAEVLEADVVLLGTGASPRILPTAQPDGERILSWRDVYDLTALPERLVVVGSGVTGAEFASGYCELGVPVTLVSSRDRVLPGEDPDAADVIEQVFTSRGGT